MSQLRLDIALGQWSAGQGRGQKGIFWPRMDSGCRGRKTRVTVMIGAETVIYLAASESVFEFPVWTYKLIHQIQFELWYSSSQDFPIMLKQNLFGNQHFFILSGMSSEYKSFIELGLKWISFKYWINWKPRFWIFFHRFHAPLDTSFWVMF